VSNKRALLIASEINQPSQNPNLDGFQLAKFKVLKTNCMINSDTVHILEKSLKK
jgi:hypothetical protein